MAKKKKKAADDKAVDKAGDKTGKPATSAAAASTPTTPAEVAFQRGNYSAVHHLAKTGDESAKKLEPLTTIDMGQVAAGIVAMIVTLTIAFLTVRG